MRFFTFFQMLVGVTSNVSNCDTPLFRQLVAQSNKIFPSFLGQLRDRNSDQVAVTEGQKITDSHIQQVDQLLSIKEKDLMAV